MLEHFATVDRRLHALVSRLDPEIYRVELPQTALECRLRLYRIIVGQQLSTKSAAAIWRRVEPQLKADPDLKCSNNLFKAGLSRPKVGYLQNLSNLDIEALRDMDEAEMRQHLLAVKGVGHWTVDMFAIFVLGRRDVFSWADLGLRRSAALFYNLPKPEDLEELQSRIERLSPYRSVVALVLWHWYDNHRTDTTTYYS